jgi:hypothetical protein
MKWKFTSYRMLALTAVVLMAAGTTMAIGTHRGVYEPMLGSDWQCSRTMLLVTICAHSSARPEQMPKQLAGEPLADDLAAQLRGDR